MDHIELAGTLGAIDSFDLSERLGQVTAIMRPAVTVDLSHIVDLHPSVVSVLIRHRRQARRQGGDLHMIPPSATAARRTLEHIGIVGAIGGQR